VGGKELYLFSVSTGCRAHTACVYTCVGLKLTTHLSIVQVLRMSETTTPFRLKSSWHCVWTILPVKFHFKNVAKEGGNNNIWFWVVVTAFKSPTLSLNTPEHRGCALKDYCEFKDREQVENRNQMESDICDRGCLADCRLDCRRSILGSDRFISFLSFRCISLLPSVYRQ
jgi:hypothetical protein